MDISAHAGESAASRRARKQRYFLPHSDDKTTSLGKNDFLTLPDVEHDTICLMNLHSDILRDTSTTHANVRANMSETRREDLTILLAEPPLVASPTTSDSESSVPTSPEPKNKYSALPSRSILDKAADLKVVDGQGRLTSFHELYRADPGQRRHVMVIFIRHFFCGNCQEFLRTLISQIPPTSLPTDTSIAIIGCGSYTLIPSYIELTSCPYPVYADSKKTLFDLLGMKRTLSLGWHAPNYIHHSLATGVVKSIGQAMKRLPEGDMLKAGDFSQNGGEYLFEVEGVDTSTTKQEHPPKPKGNMGLKVKVTFCHRMRNSRDHTEISQLFDLLGLSENEARSRRAISKLKRRWTSSETLGNLARSLSNRRQSWLESRNSSRLSSRRRRDRSESSNPGDAVEKKGSGNIETDGGDMKNRICQRPSDQMTKANALASINRQQIDVANKRFSFTEDEQ